MLLDDVRGEDGRDTPSRLLSTGGPGAFCDQNAAGMPMARPGIGHRAAVACEAEVYTAPG